MGKEQVGAREPGRAWSAGAHPVGRPLEFTARTTDDPVWGPFVERRQEPDSVEEQVTPRRPNAARGADADTPQDA